MVNDRNLAKIKFYTMTQSLRSPICPSGREKANASAAGKHNLRSHITSFLIPNLRVDIRESLAKKKNNNHVENLGDFR